MAQYFEIYEELSNMSVSVIERIRSSDPFYRKVRESHWIEQFESLRKGINRKRWQFANCKACKKNLILVCLCQTQKNSICYDKLLSEDAFVKKVKIFKVLESYML